MENVEVTYDDVMVDWAVAELLSPTWTGFWNGRIYDELRTKLRDEGVGSLSAHERTFLIGRLIVSRNLIIFQNGPLRCWTFKRPTFSREDLSGFSIIHQFGHPSLSFGQFSERIRTAPSEGLNEPEMQRAVLAMLEESHRGNA